MESFSHERLASLRRARGFSQPELAAASLVNLGTLRALEQGRIRNPRIQTVAALARGLGVTVEELFADTSVDDDLLDGVVA